MDIELSTTAVEALMRLSGRFDFTARNQFLAKADETIAGATTAEIKVDLGQVDYIDSSALGMLLMLRDKAKKHDKTVALLNARGQVREVITTAQFDRLFPVR
jgi:HptB-dependent secretion and biofilm anti anti-sigma factor